ncbi:MAG: hypothetical protein MIO90_02180 [Methanomassiliicoccales archaeon]|nr:hypothetical protein [Methanomassiliicoccales archaeon]
MVDIVAKASIYPTEDLERVSRSLLNLFPESELTVSEGQVEVRTVDLSRFKQLIRNHKILDSTRAVMLRGVEGERITFQLNKQAAFVSKISFAEGKVPMAPIFVEISVADPEALRDDVAPSTVNGVIP